MKRWPFLSVCVIGLVAIALLLLLNTRAVGEEPPAGAGSAGQGLQQDPPTVLVVGPSEAPNNLDTTITITGTGFQAELSGTQVLTAPVVGLDGFSLVQVGWVSSQTLTATVPWGLDPGVYTATVTNPGGDSGALAEALTVTQAIGVWTTGGPYAGSVHMLAVNPVISTTAFAWVVDVGLFGTMDGGDTWELKLYDKGGWGVAYGIAPTHTLYFWGSIGLWRSGDNGQTFQQIAEGIVTTFAPDPQDEDKLWIGKHPHNVLYTANGGLNWEVRSTDLPDDSWPAALAVDPLTPSIVYTALEDGRVFKTTTTGMNWIDASTGLPSFRPFPPYTLAIHPFSPNVILFAPAIGSEPAYRSTDGGGTWLPVEIEHEGNIITDVAFSPHVSGTVYGSWTGSGYFAGVSTDGGATWSALDDYGSRSDAVSIGLYGATGLPIYLGGLATGAWRSSDGGQTWELATHGITGMMVQDVAAVAAQPERVFVAGEGAGGFVSDNAGQSWQQLDLPYTFAEAIAVDPQQPERVYVSPGHSVFLSQDGGATWDHGPPIPGSQDIFIETMDIDPASTGTIYAAGRDDAAWVYNHSVGFALRSDDYGMSWDPLTFTLPISAVCQILVHPTEPLTVYVAAGRWTWDLGSGPGKGIFRSRDRGQTWERTTQGMDDAAAFAVAIHPDRPRTIYATAWLAAEGKVTVFKSMDGGDTWEPTSLRMDYDYRGNPLVIDPLAPDTLFAGGQDGLFRSVDGGLTWTRAAGDLGQVSVTALSVASEGERTIVYVGTTGGIASGSQGGLSLDEGYVQGGIYQQTIAHRPAVAIVYLPIVAKK